MSKPQDVPFFPARALGCGVYHCYYHLQLLLWADSGYMDTDTMVHQNGKASGVVLILSFFILFLYCFNFSKKLFGQLGVAGLHS